MRSIRLAALALGVFAACSISNETAVDPFDTSALPQISLIELVKIEGGMGVGEPVLHKVSDAIVLNTGEVAIANINSEILVFGPDGELRHTLGGSGGGPGEFRFLQKIVRLDDDRILAWDPAQARVTVFRQDGELDYTCIPQGVDISQVGGGFVGAFGDGSFVLAGNSVPEAGPDAGEGVRSETIPYLLFDRSGRSVRTMAQFGRNARNYSTNSGYERYLLDTSVHAFATGGLLYVGENDSIALMRFDSSGATLTALRLDRSPRPVTAIDIEAGWHEWVEQRAVAREQMLGQAMIMLDEDDLLAMRERIRADVEEGLSEAKRTIEPAEHLPAYESVIAASDGAMWLKDYLSPTLEISRWILMDAAFSPVGWVELQPNERLLAAGPNTLVILTKDELDVESVVITSWERPEA